MSQQLDKKSILKKTVQFGGATFLSRILGIVRDILRVRFLGVGAISDAFIIAFKIPNFLRRIFAEGALSASFVPVFIRKTRSKELENGNGLMSVSFLFFEGIVFLLTLFVIIYPQSILKIIAPGFSAEQIGYAIPFLRILFPFILFVSSSALLAGALNSVNHFFVPAFGPVLLNLTFIGALLMCLYFNFSVDFFCYGIILGGFLNFLLHLAVYLKYNFSFGPIDEPSKKAFKTVLSKFLPSLFGVSIIEINLFIDGIIGSYLPTGSVSLIEYSSRFMNIPVGIFAVGFATVLLPQFSRYALYAPKRLNFYVLEVTKLVTFFIVPTMLFLMFLAEPIFSILMLGKKGTLADIWIAKWLLIVFCSGLVFFCLNKILINVFYSLHDTTFPTIALTISTVVNFIGNIIGMKLYGAFGIAASTSISAVVLTILCLLFLKIKHKFRFYLGNYFNFAWRYFLQLIMASTIFYAFYWLFFRYLLLNVPSIYLFFSASWGYWFIIFPFAMLAGAFILLTRRFFGIELYFLSK